MTITEMICDEDRRFLLEDWPGVPSERLESVVAKVGLEIKQGDLGFKEGVLDVHKRQIVVNSRLPELCDARTDLNGVWNSIVAHELGHWRLHRDMLSAGEKLDAIYEASAYTYAEEFLLPRDQLRLRPQVWEMARARKRMARVSSDHLWFLVEELAEHFQVTRSSVAYRLERLNLLHRSRGRLCLSLTGAPAAPAATRGLSCAT